MKNWFLSLLAISLLSIPAFSQTDNTAGSDTALLGLPGDNLDLFAVLNLFQQSKTIEEFEKSLNAEKTGINNLDLDLDGKVDFIKVVTKQKDQDFTFICQVDVSEKEVQDVAVILVSKDKDGKVTMQIVGDPILYGKDYVVEPKAPEPSFTANPGYTGPNPIPVSTQPASGTSTATTTTVIVESAPIVQYVYSPVYVPYYPPYYYHYYPPYYAAVTVMAVGIYRHNNYYHHGGYYGGHGNTVVVHNHNTYNNYNNNSRNTSNTVNNNRSNGNYNNASNRASAGTTASNRASTGTSATNRASTGTSASNRASTGTSASNRSSSYGSSSSRPSSSNYSSSSSKSNYSSASSRSSGASRSSYSGSGASRGGGGGRRR